jgi:DNA-binding MarR family transcriptional regulator
MATDKDLIDKGENQYMNTDNPFSKMSEFVEVTTDKSSVMIFLSVAKNAPIMTPQLIEETGLGTAIVDASLNKLEQGDFIKRNPNPASNKFTLGFNGQLFAEQLRNTYPEVRSLLGEKQLIEPLG